MAIKCLTVDENDQEKNKTNIVISFTEVWAILLCINLIFGDGIYDKIDYHPQISFTGLSMKSEKNISWFFILYYV